MLNSRQLLGKKGEEAAAEYLQKIGYTIVSRNYRTKLGEIDIIAMENSFIVFVEVKTRAGDSYGSPAAAVTLKKQRQICKAALCYLTNRKLLDAPARFDVVSVRFHNNKFKIDLITNAFELCE